MPFPSGTATAQLISVLHDIPPPGARRADESLRHRRGYTIVRSEEDPHSDGVVIEGPEDEPSQEEREVVRKEGWIALGGSFALSALMTVIFSLLSPQIDIKT